MGDSRVHRSTSGSQPQHTSDELASKSADGGTGEEMATDTFVPAGLSVLAVEQDRVCRNVLERQLQCCHYNVTMATNAETALHMLRERKDGDQFDLVISNVAVPNMDGFRLLEVIGLEMDLPVIMLSANSEAQTIVDGIKHGACDYMVKPVRLEQLRGIWTHVVKNNAAARKLPSEDGDKVEKVGANHTKKYSRKNKKVVDVADEDESTSTQKKQRVQWYGQLHQKFVQAVEQIGIDKAIPRTILEVMKVEGLTRANVVSHLQKYRIYLRKLSEGTLRKSPFAEETEALRRNMTLPSFIGSPSSSNHCAKMNSSSAIGMQVSLPIESVQVVSSQRNLGVPQSNLELVGHRPPLTSNMSFSSSRSCNSFASSSGQVPTFRNDYQNKIAGIIGNTIPMVGFREQVATFSYGNNKHSTATTIGNSALASSSSTRPDLQIDNNSAMPTQVLNGGGASDNLHVGSIVNQQAVSDQVHNINEFLMGTSESQNGERDTFNDLFAYLDNQLDFINNCGPFMDGN